jgi:hypothetical protein
MKRILAGLFLAAFLCGAGSLSADDLTALSGKWSVKKTNDQGQNFTQTIEIKKDKFVFQIIGADDNVVIHAEGDLKLEKLGPFSSAKFYHIRGGSSAGNMEEVDDEYVSVYVLDEDTWTLSSNFDKQRENQKPGVDVYKRAKAPAAAAPKPAK